VVYDCLVHSVGVRAVDAIYKGDWDAAAANLSKYDVSYVVVGPAERDWYGPAIRSFDRDAFTVVFENDAVTIYAVNHDALAVNHDAHAVNRTAR
jgi:uncharacterized membrane protein